jgi:hypothetical protein
VAREALTNSRRHDASVARRSPPPTQSTVSGEWPGGVSPPALSEPYVTVSRHTAPATQSTATSRRRPWLAQTAPPLRLAGRQARVARPLRSSPITGPSALLRDGPPLCPAPVLSPSQFPLLGDLPCATDRRPEQHHWPDRPVGATGSHVPCKSLSQARATSTPDAIWAVNRLPPDSSRDSKAFPVSTSPFSFDTSSVVRFRSPSWLTPAALIGATFPVTLTTTALYRSSSRWFAASACTATAEGHRAKPDPAPPSPAQHRIQIWGFYIQPPSTFVAHQWTRRSRVVSRRSRDCFPRKRASSPARYVRECSRRPLTIIDPEMRLSQPPRPGTAATIVWATVFTQ